MGVLMSIPETSYYFNSAQNYKFVYYKNRKAYLTETNIFLMTVLIV